MTSTDLHGDSDALAAELLAIIGIPIFDNSRRIIISDIACSLALEHWHSVRTLLGAGLLPSAAVVHRAQFEALTRSIWLLYAASDEQLAKFDATLTLDSEHAAKNVSQTNEMMEHLSKKAPPQAYDALARFKDNSWRALNSYVHAGIHPIRRHGDGYPANLLNDVLRNTNGLAVVTCMQAVVLSGQQPLQRKVLDSAARYPACMPPSL